MAVGFARDFLRDTNNKRRRDDGGEVRGRAEDGMAATGVLGGGGRGGLNGCSSRQDNRIGHERLRRWPENFIYY